jgi:hypothetical protein
MCLDEKKDGRRSQRETERFRRELKVSTKKQRGKQQKQTVILGNFGKK